MDLRIGDVIGGAINNVFSKHGFQLSLIGTVFLFLIHLSITGAATLSHTDTVASLMQTPSALIALAGLFAFLIIYAIGSIRSLHQRECAVENFTHRLGITGFHTAIGGVLVSLAIILGFIFFVVPGLILLVSLYIWAAHVAIDDESFLDAFRNAWSETKDNRWRILGVLSLSYLIAIGITVFTQAFTGFLYIFTYPLLVFITGLVGYYLQVYLCLFQAAILVEIYERISSHA